jgi:cobyrinic acid a,c-diamide synthase
MASVTVPRLVVGGVSSGVGKTTVAIALARALQARGQARGGRVALFKCGPDYLDPTYHARAVGRPAHNLDGWMMGRDAVRATFLEGARGADVAIIEGVMGLFDGASPTSEEGSTAEIAKWLDAPVVLVLDAGGMARSIAALVDGFVRFDPALRIAGVLANHVGSPGHADLLRAALGRMPLCGALPRDDAHAFAERHLGLRTADEETLPDALLEHWGTRAAEWMDLDGLVALARSAPPLKDDAATCAGAVHQVRVRARIGLAYDEAFHFYYVDNLRRLEALGATLVRFSPIRDRALPEVDGLYLGGGYPELYAEALAANVDMRRAVADFARRGAPVYAECGGLMYLTRAIRELSGARHEMVGLLPTEARMRPTLQALGYVEVESRADTILGAAGTRFRGHQFRYSELDPPIGGPEVEHVFTVRRRRGEDRTVEGYRVGNLVASYVHAHWASNPAVPEAFVASCARFAAERRR